MRELCGGISLAAPPRPVLSEERAEARSLLRRLRTIAAPTHASTSIAELVGNPPLVSLVADNRTSPNDLLDRIPLFP